MIKNRPYIIAEIGVNFFDTAKVMDITPMEAANNHYHAGDPEDFVRVINNFRWIDMVHGNDKKRFLNVNRFRGEKIEDLWYSREI